MHIPRTQTPIVFVLPFAGTAALAHQRFDGSTATRKLAAGALFAMAVLCALTLASVVADVAGVLSVDAYGYSVTVRVNGVDVGTKGGMSGGYRLFFCRSRDGGDDGRRNAPAAGRPQAGCQRNHRRLQEAAGRRPARQARGLVCG